VILGGPPVPASDVYGLGLVLYEMLTGIMPYRGGELDEALARHLRAELVVPMTVPGELRRLVEACTSVDERIRPTAAQLAHALRRLLPELGGLPAIEPLPTGTPLLHTVRRAPDAGPVAVPVRPASGPPYTPPYAPSAAPEAYPADEPVPVLLTTAPVPEPARTRTPSPNLRIVVVAAAALLVAVAAVVVVRGLGNNRNPAPQAGLPRSNGVQSTAAATDANVTGPPAAAVPATQDGAKAFVTYWFDSLNRALATGDVGLLQAASGPNCHTCANAIQVVKAGYADGGRLRGGLFTVREVTVDNFFDINKPRLGVIVDRAPRSSVAADGHQLQVFPGGTFITGFVLLERVQDHWRILDVGSDHPLV